MDDNARAWHKAHRMPKNATPDQRIEWHLAHAQNCACREIPPGILNLMKEHGIGVELTRPGASSKGRKTGSSTLRGKTR
jgi:hypothetical protein